MERGELAHHALVVILFVGMNCLSMLAEIVETRELLGTVTCEGTLAGMFSGRRAVVEKKKKKGGEWMVPDVPCEMLTPGKDHAAFAIPPTLEGLCRRWPVPFAARVWLVHDRAEKSVSANVKSYSEF